MSERQIEKYRMFEKMYGTFTRTDSVTINEGEIIPRFRRWFFKRKKNEDYVDHLMIPSENFDLM